MWEYARNACLVIVSKDSDFRQLASLHGAPPKIVCVRARNASTEVIAALLHDSVATIEAFVSRADDALLVLRCKTPPGSAEADPWP